MCGRYVLDAPLTAIAERFGVAEAPEIESLGLAGQARWNVSPGTDILAVGLRDGRRTLRPLRWGLVPGWARDPSVGNRLVNARAEGIGDKPSFRSAFRRRRCLVPATGFYEWQQVPGERLKQPWYVTPVDGQLMAFAGLWEFWQRPPGADAAWPETLRTVCLITTAPNAVMSPIHDRMPVLLPPACWEAWLDPATPVDAVAAMLRPLPDDALRAWPVSRAVSKAGTEGPALVMPLEHGAG